MIRRKFLKWLGIAPLAGFLGVKMPWPEPTDKLKHYNDTIILDQRRAKPTKNNLAAQAFADMMDRDIFKAITK